MDDTKISDATNTAPPLLSDSLPLSRTGDTTARRVTVGNLRQGVFNVRDYGAIGDGSTDDSAAIIAAIAAAAVAGGEVYFPAGTYRIDSQLLIPNDAATPPKQKSLRLTGAGPSHSGQSIAAAPNGGTILDLRYAGANGKIVTLGQGYLEIDHLSLMESGAATTTPFILTTNTTLHVHHVEGYGHSSKGTTTCDQDFIILGGTTTTIDGTVTAPFQGYGTVIENNYINRLRRFAYLRTYANAIQITNNTAWAQCGSNLAGGACIELDGTVALNYCTGNYFAGNLIEMVGYPYAFKLTLATLNTFFGNNLYDASLSAPTLAHYRFESGGNYNMVIHGFGDDAIPTFSDSTAATNTLIQGHQTQPSIISQPWLFKNLLTLENGTSGIYINDADGTGQVVLRKDSGNTLRLQAAGANNFIIKPGSGGQIRFMPNNEGLHTLCMWDDGRIGINNNAPTISGTGKLHMTADTFRLDTARTPASAGATGNKGDICWDTGFIYVCVATNTWKRAAIATW